MTLFALQLAINLGWTVVFFGLQKIASAVATIVVLDVAVLVTMLAFRAVDQRGGVADAALRRLGGVRDPAQRGDLAPQSGGLSLLPFADAAKGRCRRHTATEGSERQGWSP